MLDPYEVLGVPRDATEADIKAAKRRAAKETHPDAGGKREHFEEVQVAARILLNPASRARFDETGVAEETRPDNIRAEAVGIIEQALRAVVTNDSIDIERDDLVAAIASIIDANVQKFRRAKASAEAQAKRFDRLAKKFRKRRGTGNDFIGDRLREQAKLGRIDKENFERQITACLKAIEMVNEYDYDIEQAVAGWVTFKAESSTSTI